MTTEVLRNMIYAALTGLGDLRCVVLDEVHYLEDRYRGSVWEEIILSAPPTVALVCLSATVSNAEELAGWIEQVRGSTAHVIEERRPIELRHLYVVGIRATASSPCSCRPSSTACRTPRRSRSTADPGRSSRPGAIRRQLAGRDPAGRARRLPPAAQRGRRALRRGGPPAGDLLRLLPGRL